MTQTTVSTGPPPARLSLPSRFVGIITSPKETYQSVVAHPRWLGMFLLVTVLTAVCTALPMTTEAGQEASLRASIEGMESFGMTVSDEAYEQMRRRLWFTPYQTALGILIASPIFTVIIAGLLFLVFNVAMGGGTTFKHVFTVLVHAGAISALQQLFTAPVNYFRGAVTSATNLAVLVPGADPKSFLGRVLAMTDLFLLWYLFVLAIGLAVLFRRRTQPIAISLYAVYAVIVFGFAAVMSRLGGS